MVLIRVDVGHPLNMVLHSIESTRGLHRAEIVAKDLSALGGRWPGKTSRFHLLSLFRMRLAAIYIADRSLQVPVGWMLEGESECRFSRRTAGL